MASAARYQSELDAGPEEWKNSLKFGPPDQAEQDPGPSEDALSLDKEEEREEKEEEEEEEKKKKEDQESGQGDQNNNDGRGEDVTRTERIATLQKTKFEEERQQMRSELVQHMKSR